MRKNKVISVALILCTAAMSFTGCSVGQGSIKPDSPSDGKYSTQYANSAVEYYMYLAKQTSVFTNQLTTHMMLIANSSDADGYELQIKSAQQSIDTMQDTLDEVEVTAPSVNAEDDRENIILAMQLAIEHMTGYKEALEKGEDVSGFKTDFQNDFNAITALANNYYE